MIPLYSTKQIRKVDDYAINKLGLPGIVLMENAAREIFEHIVTNYHFNSIGIVCGNGNNGGDGFAVARHFVNEGYKVVVIYLGPANKMSPDCGTNYSVLKKMEPTHKNLTVLKYRLINSLNKVKSCELICDALLGSGAKGNLENHIYLSLLLLKKVKK